MGDPLIDQVVLWVGLAVLLLLCLPVRWIQKLVLEVYALVLRLVLLATVAGAAYVTYRPADMPVQVRETLNNFPQLKSILPQPTEQHFPVCAAALVVLVVLPVLAVLDVSRKLAGWRLRRLRVLAAQPEVVPAVGPEVKPVSAVQRIDRRAAADTLAKAGSRRLPLPPRTSE